MAYRHNETDKQIDQVEEAAADSNVVVNSIGGNVKKIGNAGAGLSAYPRKNGVVGSFKDNDYVVNAKAGKSRTSEKN